MRGDAWLYAVGIAVVVLAKGLSVFPLGFSVDSYPKLVAMSGPDDFASLRTELLSQGRLGQLLLNELLGAFGLANPGANVLVVLLAMLCFVAAGVTLVKLWRLEADRLACVAVLGLFAIHPYNAEIFTFREAVLVVGLSIYLGIGGVALAERFGARWLGGVLAIVAALAFYQVSLNFVVAALATACLIDLSLRRAVSGTDVRTMLLGLLPRCLAVAAAIPLYAVLYVVCQRIAGWTVEQDRGALLAASQLGLRFENVKVTTWKMLAAAEPIMPALVKALILLLGAIAVAAVVVRLAAFKRAAPLLIAIAFALFGVAGLATMGVMLVLETWWPVDRMLAAVSVLVAGFAAIGVAAGGPAARRATLAISAVVLFGFIGANNVVLSEQLRLNDRDRATAIRIVDRLEQLEQFRPDMKVAIAGFRTAYPLRYRSAKAGSDLNASAFAKPWSNLNLLREVSGYSFVDPTDEERARAQAACHGGPQWPARGSVRVHEGVAVVCMGHPE